MKYLSTFWYWLVFATSAPIVWALAVVVTLLTSPFDPQRNVLHAVICRICFQYLRIWPGWRIRVEGRENIPSGACVLVANHQSVADIFAAMGLFRRFKFVSKASLFQVPLLGWTMTLLKYVRVERGSPRSTRDMLEACKDWLRSGMPVLLFPEGTYRETETLLPFKRGPFRLAREMNVPIVPVAIHGTFELIRGDGPLLAPRSDIRVVVLEPVSPAASEAGDGPLAENVRGRIGEVLVREHARLHAGSSRR